MKGAALRCPGSGDQEPCGPSWYCFVMTETELRERRGEERRVTAVQTLVRGTGGCNEGHLVTEQGIQIYQSI